MADYTINNIYQGGYSSLKPSYGDIFTGYHVAAGEFGLTTDPRSANILQETSAKLSTGIKQIELSEVSPEVFESIPKQHLKEINRLSKLTGVDVSVHAPVIEASGISKEGFSESNREAIERQMTSAVEKSHEINPDGSAPVTFHSSAILPGQIKPKKGEPQEAFVINKETGSINKIPIKEGKFPGEETNIDKELQKINETQWRQSLTHLGYNLERGSEIMESSQPLAIAAKAEEKAEKELTPEEKHAKTAFNIGTTYLNDSYRELKELYDIAYRNSGKKEQGMLDGFGKKIQTKVEKINQDPKSNESVILRQQIIEEGLETLNKLPNLPQIYKPLDEFAKEKTTETFANVAFDSYKKFKNKAPIISVENPPVGTAFSTGEELKMVVEESRKKFVERAVKEGISKSEAVKQAEKLIGVTWDVGHINMLRKYGYEAKDVIKETEAVKPLVKHIHLSDNFGFEHTELPMGMGNVPTKEIMEKLGKEGFEAKKIVEAASWWQHFKTPPVQETFQAMGSPIYSMYMAPYWNQTIGLQQGYYEGLGPFLPQGHFETFGGGFSQLPSEVGGARPGAQGSRMSGKPME